MNKIRTLAMLLALLTAIGASGSEASGPAASPTAVESTASRLPNNVRISERIYGQQLPGLTNVGRIAPGIYRGAQPDEAGYATLKKMGIRTIVNLRTTSEKEAVEKAGMRSIELPMTMSADSLRRNIDQAVAILADPENRPVFVHCRHGRDRTGVVVAAYRMKEEGWPYSDAKAEMEAFGFNDIWISYKRFIKEYGNEVKKDHTVKK